MQNRILGNYNWDKQKTCTHDYLLCTIVRTLESVNVPETIQILDAGCGGEYVMFELYRKVYENIWGFDVSISGIEVSQNSFHDIKDRFDIHDAYELRLHESFPDADMSKFYL